MAHLARLKQMCGIFGLMARNGFAINDYSELGERLFFHMRHRGPDDRGFVVFSGEGRLAEGNSAKDSALLLGQTRLSIIDLSPAGHQPMFSADGRYCLVYNGEVYNYLELRAELEALGVQFKSHTDTEVLLYALIHWGKACLTRLVGMFAFAFYDTQEKTLFCARDFFGIKPFYYHTGEDSFCFASELPSLFEFPNIPKKIAPQQAYNFLCFGKYDMGGTTFVKDVFQLPPAHHLTISFDNPVPQIERYWKIDLSKRSDLSFGAAAARLREMFLESVRLHLRSDVPLGVALSGGIDSSAVTCAVRHVQPDTELHTFSFIAKGSPMSEEHWASLVAQETHAIRHIVEVDPGELVNDLDDMIRHLGEPFGSTSIYAQYRVFKLARDSGIKVTLDGQGADELLAGYDGYPGQRVSTMLLSGRFISAIKFLSASLKWPGRTMGKVVKQIGRELVPAPLVPLALKLAGSNPAPPWLDVTELKRQQVEFTLQDERRSLYSHRDRVRQTLAYQLTWEGLPQLLRHGDRNAMAFSIESRVPFLTREIAEFCLSLPEEYLVDMTGRTKSVFREAMRDIVPDEILDRRDKIGFQTPEADWLNALSPWVEETLGEAKDIPYINLAEARKEWEEIKAGRKAYNLRVWRWLNYVRWVELFELEA